MSGPTDGDGFAPVPPAGRVFGAARAVRLGDVTPRGRLRLDALARYLQDVAADDSADASLAEADAWVVRRTAVVVHRPAVYQERLTLSTFCSGWGSRWAERRTSITGSRGASVEAAAVWVHVDLATGRPKRLPSQFHDLYAESAGGRQVTARLGHPEPDPDASRRPWPIRFADFDVLGHVNNAAYWVVLEEELAGRDIRAPMRAEIEYRAGIDRGEQVEVAVAPAEPALQLWLLAGGTVRASGRVDPLRPPSG